MKGSGKNFYKTKRGEKGSFEFIKVGTRKKEANKLEWGIKEKRGQVCRGRKKKRKPLCEENSKIIRTGGGQKKRKPASPGFFYNDSSPTITTLVRPEQPTSSSVTVLEHVGEEGITGEKKRETRAKVSYHQGDENLFSREIRHATVTGKR